VKDLESRIRITISFSTDRYALISNHGAINTIVLFRNAISYSEFKQTTLVLFTTTKIRIQQNYSPSANIPREVQTFSPDRQQALAALKITTYCCTRTHLFSQYLDLAQHRYTLLLLSIMPGKTVFHPTDNILPKLVLLPW